MVWAWPILLLGKDHCDPLHTIPSPSQQHTHSATHNTHASPPLLCLLPAAQEDALPIDMFSLSTLVSTRGSMLPPATASEADLQNCVLGDGAYLVVSCSAPAPAVVQPASACMMCSLAFGS